MCVCVFVCVCVCACTMFLTLDSFELGQALNYLTCDCCRKPIFGCIGVQDHEPSWEAAYDLRPFGVCMQFIKKGSKTKIDDWLKDSRQFAANWSHSPPV